MTFLRDRQCSIGIWHSKFSKRAKPNTHLHAGYKIVHLNPPTDMETTFLWCTVIVMAAISRDKVFGQGKKS